MALGSAVYVYRKSNAQWQANGWNGDPLGESMGFGPYQGFVDFDALGPTFLVVLGGSLGSDGLGPNTITWRVRVGGNYDINDGTVALAQPYPETPAFGKWTVHQVVTNQWFGGGIQLVKVTSQSGNIHEGGFMQNPTLLFIPVI